VHTVTKRVGKIREKEMPGSKRTTKGKAKIKE
jgi:hypothetical protein